DRDRLSGGREAACSLQGPLSARRARGGPPRARAATATPGPRRRQRRRVTGKHAGPHVRALDVAVDAEARRNGRDVREHFEVPSVGEAPAFRRIGCSRRATLSPWNSAVTRSRVRRGLKEVQGFPPRCRLYTEQGGLSCSI